MSRASHSRRERWADCGFSHFLQRVELADRFPLTRSPEYRKNIYVTRLLERRLLSHYGRLPLDLDVDLAPSSRYSQRWSDEADEISGVEDDYTESVRISERVAEAFFAEDFEPVTYGFVRGLPFFERWPLLAAMTRAEVERLPAVEPRIKTEIDGVPITIVPDVAGRLRSRPSRLTIPDFKGSSKPPDPHAVEDHDVQLAIYAKVLEHVTGKRFDKLVHYRYLCRIPRKPARVIRTRATKKKEATFKASTAQAYTTMRAWVEASREYGCNPTDVPKDVAKMREMTDALTWQCWSPVVVGEEARRQLFADFLADSRAMLEEAATGEVPSRHYRSFPGGKCSRQAPQHRRCEWRSACVAFLNGQRLPEHLYPPREHPLAGSNIRPDLHQIRRTR